jgi:hypothetical protein
MICPWSETITGNGNPIVGASVLITVAGVAATIYENDGVTHKLNPLTSNASGVVSCYLEDGDYRLLVTAPGYIDKTIDINVTLQGCSINFRTLSISGSIDPTTDGVILCNALATPMTVTWPSIAAVPAGVAFITKKVDSSDNIVTNVVDGGGLMDGVASKPLTMEGEILKMAHDGTIWREIS